MKLQLGVAVRERRGRRCESTPRVPGLRGLRVRVPGCVHPAHRPHPPPGPGILFCRTRGLHSPALRLCLPRPREAKDAHRVRSRVAAAPPPARSRTVQLGRAPA